MTRAEVRQVLLRGRPEPVSARDRIFVVLHRRTGRWLQASEISDALAIEAHDATRRATICAAIARSVRCGYLSKRDIRRAGVRGHLCTFTEYQLAPDVVAKLLAVADEQRDLRVANFKRKDA